MKSIGKFFSDFGWLIVFLVMFSLLFLTFIAADARDRNRDEFCLVQQQVVVRYHGAPYCADLNSLVRVK